MFAENSRGYKLGGNALADELKISESPLPMNIQKHRWSKIIDKNPDEMYDPDKNVAASVALLRRIADSVEKPTPEKIGTLWNDLDSKKVNK